ncbi:host-nuclease inhibitor Gam family protein [uncultured Tateyamaria sp.]|uniref:host-nuclease inhibitor Gam family protein n=1 Tax=uncultured Tateyamaria sp. TaxID=455651 RepID=UPI00260C2F9B|nr:host-nuclease inhibitor Gam family protein [uncultured Tateyamaria sp.]
MAKRKVKTTAANLPIPQDDSEARSAIREIGDLSRDALRLEAEMNDKIAKLQEEYGEMVEPIRELITAKQEGLKMFCEVNRDRLTKDGKVKFHKFETGEISWRLRPAKVTIRGKDDVIAAIKQAKLSKKFLRTKIEINKDAMLEKENRSVAAAISGVTIGSDGEDFIVEPFETELAEAN